MLHVPYVVEERPNKVVVFEPLKTVWILGILVTLDKEFLGVGEDDIELHANPRTRSVEACLYQKHEPLTPIEGPTPGKVAGQFVWGNNCRVSLEEIFGVASHYFPNADENGGVVLFVDGHGNLVMEPAED